VDFTGVVAARPLCKRRRMRSSPAVDAARNFLSVIWSANRPTDGAVLATLDRLTAAYHDVPDTSPSDTELEAPRQDGASLYKEAAARFEDYGLYPIADPSASFGEAAMTGDAVDDIADLTLDLREVVWFAEHVSVDDAHWAFRLHFPHWGRHARELALYLHARLW
jgi:hypothetical protein